MKLSKRSLTWVRISILSLLVIVMVTLISRDPFIKKWISKMKGPALTSAGQQWDLELNTTYTLCKHNEVSNQSFTALKDLKQASARMPNLTLKEVTEHHYIYEASVAGYCSNCRNHQFLGIDGPTVAIIRGTPEKPGPVLEKLEIRIENLPKLELEDLRKGIPFKTDSEKLQLIEGLKGLITN